MCPDKHSCYVPASTHHIVCGRARQHLVSDVIFTRNISFVLAEVFTVVLLGSGSSFSSANRPIHLTA